MTFSRATGLTVPTPRAPAVPDMVETDITAEAAITALPNEDLRIELLVAEDDLVAQGAPILRSRRHPEIVLTAPMASRVVTLDFRPGRRLTMVRFLHEPRVGRHRYDVAGAEHGGSDARLREVLQATGFWRLLRSRPFGKVPTPDERATAVFVMALDTRPLAPDPRLALSGAEEDFERGLAALLRLTEGPVFLCQPSGREVVAGGTLGDRLKTVKSGNIHPWGQAGFHIHARCPAEIGRTVWDIGVEDVAAIGYMLRTGHVQDTRMISVAGEAMKTARLVRCQPGADLRGLTYRHVAPGPHILLSGSPMDGREARWLGLRDRQATALHSHPRIGRRHWFAAALERALRPLPLIPTAALDRAMGGALPTTAFLRAVSAGDSETVVRLGGLSLLAEDLSLVDYLTGADPEQSRLFQQLLQAIELEFKA